jgi:hypothetical protein
MTDMVLLTIDIVSRLQEYIGCFDGIVFKQERKGAVVPSTTSAISHTQTCDDLL